MNFMTTVVKATTPREGYIQAKADIEEYLKEHNLISGRLRRGDQFCALGVLYEASGVFENHTPMSGMAERYDGAQFTGLTYVNDGAAPITRAARVLVFLDDKIN